MPKVTTENSDHKEPEVSNSASVSKEKTINTVTSKANNNGNEPFVTNPAAPLKSTNDTQEKKTEITKPESKIKRASAGGTLLPPMFSSNATFSNEAFIAEEYNADESSEIVTLRAIPYRNYILTTNASEAREINYTIRELPIYNDELIYKSASNESSWAVALNATPLISYRSLGTVSSENVYSADITSNYEQNYTNEKPLLSYSTGIDLSYRISSRWGIRSGIYISQIGQISEDVSLMDYQSFDSQESGYFNLNTSAGNIRVEGTTSDLAKNYLNDSDHTDIPSYLGEIQLNERNTGIDADFIQAFSFYEIPMLVSYKLIDKKLSMNLSGGFSANILYSNKTFVKESTGRQELDGETQNVKNTGYNGIVGFGFEYPLISKLNFNLQPTFRYSISPINDEGNVHPYSFGVYTGVIYSF